MSMTEETQLPSSKAIKTNFVGDADLVVHYINTVNIRGGLEDFFITLGTVVPLEVTDIKDLDAIDTVNARAIFRFAMPRSVLKQMIDLMQKVYDGQSEQLVQLKAKMEENQVHE